MCVPVSKTHIERVASQNFVPSDQLLLATELGITITDEQTRTGKTYDGPTGSLNTRVAGARCRGTENPKRLP